MRVVKFILAVLVWVSGVASAQETATVKWEESAFCFKEGKGISYSLKLGKAYCALYFYDNGTIVAHAQDECDGKTTFYFSKKIAGSVKWEDSLTSSEKLYVISEGGCEVFTKFQPYLKSLPAKSYEKLGGRWEAKTASK